MAAHLNLTEVERKVCEIVARYGAVDLSHVSPETQPTADLGIDSMDWIEMVMEIEDTFDMSLPKSSEGDSIVKAVFARKGLRIADIAEVVYLRQGAGRPPRRGGWFSKRPPAQPPRDAVPFTQLGGVWRGGPLFEPLDAGQNYRRLTDGMRCVQIPAATVEIGGDMVPDERPSHAVELGAFLMDAEPVSTTAYCRFLNTIGPVSDEVYDEWFALPAEDKRRDHAVIVLTAEGWRPVPGTERLPMVLVSWEGANAYAAWANGHDTTDTGDFLPSEAQWEYAARGAKRRQFPWGDGPATPELAVFGRHARGDEYEAATLPMAAVNDRLGMSPFGLHHMAGNVWHWCLDWYAADFYRSQPATYPDAVNVTPTGIRTERGGSWVGPAELCRSSYRRGRPPHCRGRCLGFRCVSKPQAV